jgi:hypothetical protein
MLVLVSFASVDTIYYDGACKGQSEEGLTGIRNICEGRERSNFTDSQIDLQNQTFGRFASRIKKGHPIFKSILIYI